MDEFTSIAIWLLATFLLINVSIIWFAGQPGLPDGMNLNLPTNNTFNESDLNQSKVTFFGLTCESVSATELQFAPCFIQQILISGTTIAGKIVNALWTFLTAWVGLMDAVLTPIPGGIGVLLKNIFIPFFGLVEAAAIFVILMRIAGIIRGGS
jgi:hypothetical protein